MSTEHGYWLAMAGCVGVLISFLINNPWRKAKPYTGAAFIAAWRYDGDAPEKYEIFTTRTEAYAMLGRLCESACASKSYKLVSASVKEITF